MIKDFDEVKRQLEELATVINGFKSEAVQLKIVELVLGGTLKPPADAGQHLQTTEGKQRRRRRQSTRKGAPAEINTGTKAGGRSRRRGSGNGPAATLDALIDDGYFGDRRTIGQIVEHCAASKARNFKPNELSGPLGRFVRDGKLKRQKNSDDQFEYFVG